MNVNQAMRCATAVSFALALSTAYAGGDTKNTGTDSKADSSSTQMTGKQKATAIGAATGAAAGAVVGGPVGAVVGAGVGGYVGHEGTNAQGKVTNTEPKDAKMASMAADDTVRDAQVALNNQGYDAGAPDGQWGPNTQSAVRRFQNDKGLTQTGTLDPATLNALGVSK